eukprot:TRINITY_DN12760_c0_g1_i1.p1 TRINITY_DN12760_c0_g1~~TRINITY_DN12760_c0_g1_i1.p1  ORF type:complete len:351 (+),score=51.50 TRINITY_DN12760_c0_g1_i1:30-1082(+)
MIRRPPRSTQSRSSAASDVYKRQGINAEYMGNHYIYLMGNEALLLMLAHIVPSSISFLFSGSIIIAYILHPKIRTHLSVNLIKSLSISTLISNILVIVSYLTQSEDIFSDKTLVCQLESFLLQFSKVSVIAWTAMIAYTTYKNCVMDVRLEEIKRTGYTFNFYCYVLPMFIALIPFLFHLYGYDKLNHTCWIRIRQNHPREFYYDSIALYYGPLWLIILLSLFAYCLIFRVTKERLGDTKLSEFSKKLVMYQVPLILCFLPESIYRVYFVLSNNSYWTIEVACISLLNFIGFFNSLVYGSDVLSLLAEERPFSYICFPFKKNDFHLEDSVDSEELFEERSRAHSLTQYRE